MSEPIRAELSAFSAVQGKFENVTLLTGAMEAGGHGIYVDEQTVAGAMKHMLGKPVAAYLKHDGAGSDRLGSEIGFFSGIYRDGLKLKARAFDFLDAFKREAAGTYEKLVEMAQKVPDQFGVSLVLSYLPVWVMPDGSDLPAMLGGKAPAGAVRTMPSMRVLNVFSADFVKRPAANPNGLLSADPQPPVDGKPIVNMSDSVITFDQASVDAKLAEQKTALASEQVAALAAKETEHGAALAAIQTAHAAALAVKDGELAALAVAHAAEIHAIKAELDVAHKNSAAKLGVPPIKFTRALVAELTTPAAKLAHWDKMPEGLEKNQFRRANLNELLQAAQSRA